MSQYPEIIEYQAAMGAGGPSGSNTVDIEVYGYDFDVTNQMAQQIIALTKELPGARDVFSDRDDDRPEIKIIVDKEKASRHGLTSATISTYLRNRVNGMAVGFLKEDGDEYNIVVRLKEDNRNSINDVLDFTVPTPTGKNIKLSEICSVDEYWAPPKIVRKARQRILTIKVTPYETSLGELAEEIQTKVLPQIDKPAGYTIRLAGAYEDQQESFGKLIALGILILILVYIVMASQFESLGKPFIIMFTVPFALSGVILALWMTGTSLDMIGALGVVLLVGIVVKNGIVLVDYTNLMRERGYDLNEAIQISGASRLRPVLMTAFTTVLGMVPMAVSQGEGAEMWRPLGIVVIGGLTISTFLTLYIVPVLYGAISRKGERDKVKKLREQFIFMDIDVKDCDETKNA
jgi:HAE1 family hydrophobic/amphiphilic exporter-1